MRYRKFLTSGILTGAICLLTVLALTTEKAEAWSWYGYSELCVYNMLRGPEGETVTFTLENVIVYTQCFNINGGNLGQPGVGNLGFEELVLTTEEAGPGKLKGIVSVEVCIYLEIFDNHYLEGHIHTCWPLNNVYKIEQLGSAWIAEFEVSWVWQDKNGRVINEGTDTCFWPGGFDEDGMPQDCVAFDCVEESVKKIKWVESALPCEE